MRIEEYNRVKASYSAVKADKKFNQTVVGNAKYSYKFSRSYRFFNQLIKKAVDSGICYVSYESS